MWYKYSKIRLSWFFYDCIYYQKLLNCIIRTGMFYEIYIIFTKYINERLYIDIFIYIYKDVYTNNFIV